MSDCKLVFIEWEDSAQPIPGWQHLADFESRKVVKCASVGWLVEDGIEVKALAPNMGGLESECNVQVSGVIHIPTRCILQIVELEEPEITSGGLSSRLETTQTQQAL